MYFFAKSFMAAITQKVSWSHNSCANRKKIKLKTLTCVIASQVIPLPWPYSTLWCRSVYRCVYLWLRVLERMGLCMCMRVSKKKKKNSWAAALCFVGSNYLPSQSHFICFHYNFPSHVTWLNPRSRGTFLENEVKSYNEKQTIELTSQTLITVWPQWVPALDSWLKTAILNAH